VYRGTLDGKPVAVKETANRAGVAEELKALAGVPAHPHVVRYHGFVRVLGDFTRAFTHKGAHHKKHFPYGSVLIVQELLNGGDLYDAVREKGPAPSFAALKRWAVELAEGVAHIHRAGYVHGDLKLPNAMLHDGVVKVVDLGLCKAIGADSVGLCGTVCHMAPELFGAGGRSRATDVWALGITLYMLFSERDPDHDHTNLIDHTRESKELGASHCAKVRDALLTKRLRPDLTTDLRAMGRFNGDLARAIAKCWESDPAKRWASVDLLAAAPRAVGGPEPPIVKPPVERSGGSTWGRPIAVAAAASALRLRAPFTAPATWRSRLAPWRSSRARGRGHCCSSALREEEIFKAAAASGCCCQWAQVTVIDGDPIHREGVCYTA
jgi:serine/threonine protein kinase